MLVGTLRRIRSSSLGRRDSRAESAWQVVRWWEARRIAFNLLVGTAGIITAVIMLTTAAISERLLGEPIGMPDPPIFAVLGAVAFVVGANVCYTGGWVAELLVRRAWPDQSEQFGTLTFTLGLPFAVVVTLLPAALVSLVAIGVGLARWFGYA
jgi:hypothetical protein